MSSGKQHLFGIFHFMHGCVAGERRQTGEGKTFMVLVDDEVGYEGYVGVHRVTKYDTYSYISTYMQESPPLFVGLPVKAVAQDKRA